jgi:hypothetical protein
LESFPVPLTFSAVTLDQEATIEIVADGQDDEPDFEGLVSVINCVALLLSWGGCPGPGLRPTERPAVSFLPPEVTGSQVRQSFRVNGVHHGAYNLFLTVLAQLHFTVFPLRAATLRAIGNGAPLTFDRIVAAGFPASPVPLPFEPQIPDDVLGGGEMVFRVRFASADASQFFPQIQNRIMEWSNVTAFGGYLDTFEETDDMALHQRETVDRFADTIEHWILAVALNRAAIDGLLNLLCRIHGTVSPIAELEIE